MANSSRQVPSNAGSDRHEIIPLTFLPVRPWHPMRRPRRRRRSRHRLRARGRRNPPQRDHRRRPGRGRLLPGLVHALWFEDVCEDAISIKGDGTANIVGGGAFHASDKVIQHNGCGTVNIKNFYAEDYGKVYRSCGNCSGNCARSVTMEGVTAVDGGELIGINPNMGDKASYSNNCFDTSTQCQGYVGCDKSEGECEPDKAEAC
jgi:hypothetical protein